MEMYPLSVNDPSLPLLRPVDLSVLIILMSSFLIHYSVDLDQMLCYVVSELGLHFLHISLKGLFTFIGAGIVPYGSPKTSPHTSS